jgi:hypothetical protein
MIRYIYVIYLFNTDKIEIEYIDCAVDTEKEAKDMCAKLNTRQTKNNDGDYRYDKTQIINYE